MTVRIHVHINAAPVPSRGSTVLYDAQQKLAKCYSKKGIGCGIVMWFQFAIIARLWIINSPIMRVTLPLLEHKRTTFFRSRYRLGFKIELWTTTERLLIKRQNKFTSFHNFLLPHNCFLMYVYKIIDTAEPKAALGYATTAEEASDLAQKAADHYAGLEHSGEIEVHRLKTNELYLGGVYWETLIETVSFTAIPYTEER